MKIYDHFFRKYHQPVIISNYESGKIFEINDQALLLFEKSKEDFRNLKRTDIFPEKVIGDLNKQFSAGKKNATALTFILNKEGKKINVEVVSELIEEDNKNFLCDTISAQEDKQVYPDSDHEFQKLIKESEVKYRTLFESASDAIFLLRDKFIIDLNSKAAEMFSGTKEELLGKTPYELSPELQPDGKRSDEQALEKIKKINEGYPQFFEWQHRKLDNTLFDAEVSLNSILIRNEVYVLAIVRDISKRKKDENALRNNEALFRSLVEESLVGVYIIQDGKFPYVNPRLAEIFGYKPEEIINIMNVDDFIVEEDRKKAEENIIKRLSGEVKTVNYSFRGVRKDKSIVEIEVIGTLTIFKEKPAVIGTLLDISERNKADKKIKNLSRAVEQSPASIIITDTEGNIEYVNSKFSEITGYVPDDVIGKNPRIFKYGDSPKNFYENLWKTIKSGEEWRGEFLNKKKNGELFWEFASISPVKDKDGRIINFLAIKEDITQRKNMEEELRIAKEKAEEMNRLKSVFLANMSHELRTPMVAILGYSEILKNEIVTPDLRDMANEVYESSKRFMNTLNLILDLSRIESNKEIINLVELDIVSVVKDEFDLFRNLARKKDLKLIYDLPEEPLFSLIDERMLRQIIGNITSNAVKFTNKGSVKLVVAKEEEKPDSGQVVIKIIDTGIGIPKQNQKVIFDAFRQVSEGLNRSFEGTGLGLTVSKKFAEMLNGSIEFESEFGHGTTFIIKIPVKRKYDISILNTEKTRTGQNQVNDSTQLLLVEDDQSNAGVIKFFLSNIYSLDVVSSGEEAIKMAQTKKYSAVLMDIDLGIGINGLEAAKGIKKIPGYEKTPIIAVTALAMRGDKEKFLAEGCTHYISKPFKKDTLLKTIEESINQTRT